MSRTPHRKRSLACAGQIRNHVLLSPLVQVLSAAFTAGTAILAARQGQFVDIAGYNAGLGIVAFLGIRIQFIPESKMPVSILKIVISKAPPILFSVRRQFGLNNVPFFANEIRISPLPVHPRTLNTVIF